MYVIARKYSDEAIQDLNMNNPGLLRVLAKTNLRRKKAPHCEAETILN
jgi:hypothetical protein